MKLTEFLRKSNDRDFLANLTRVNLILDITNLVDENCLLKLTDALRNCVNLQEFVLQYGFIGSNSNNTNYSIIFLALHNCQKLKNFDLAFNHVGNLDDVDIEALSFFIASSNLENISFKDNELHKLSHDNLRTLFEAIARCKNLKYLHISDNDFHIVDDIKFDIICTSLKNCENLLDFYMLVPYMPSERQKTIFEIKNYIIQRKNLYEHMFMLPKDSMQSLKDIIYPGILGPLILNKEDPLRTMMIFSKPEADLVLDENKKLTEENKVTVKQKKNSLIPPTIIFSQPDADLVLDEHEQLSEENQATIKQNKNSPIKCILM